ncbi:MAG: hypothetical protein ACYTGW_19375 [Planctomycetota bacterium]|jgi:hypothetical protein
MKTSFLCVSLGLGLLANAATAQIAIPNYSRTYTYTGHTRGFYFQAPTGFVVTHLQVPDEKNAGKQMAAIYRLTAAPPVVIPTTPDTPVFYKLIPVIPPVVYKKGEWFVVLGSAGSATTTSNNSYAANGDFKSSVLGMPITLVRAGIQLNLEAVSGKGPIWGNPGGPVNRVRVFVAGHGKAETYGKGTGLGSIPAGALQVSDPFPPSLGKKAEMILMPGTASNTGALYAIGILRSNINTSFGTLLNSPFLVVLPVPGGTIPATGTPINFNLPNTASLGGTKVTFQAAVGVQGGLTLTNGMEWIINR